MAGKKPDKEQAQQDRTRSFRPVVWRILIYLAAAAILAWVFHDIDLHKILKQLDRISWGLVLLAVAVHFLSYLSQGARWSFLLHPVGKFSFLRATQAIYIGLLANEILPFRAGEIVRIFLASRWLSVKFVAAIPSVIVGRVMDGIWMALAVAFSTAFVTLPGFFVKSVELFSAVLLGMIVVFIFIVVRGDKNMAIGAAGKIFRWKAMRAVSLFFARLVTGFRAIGFSRYLFLSFLFSLLFIFLQFLPLWILMQAYGIHLSLLPGAVVFLILALSTAIPNTPSNIGTYQFFLVIGLSLFDVSKTTAAGFSIVAFVMLTMPIWIIGFAALAMEGINLSSIRKEIQRLKRKSYSE